MGGNDKRTIYVGSRKSQLAMIQTNLIVNTLKKMNPDKEFVIITMTTTGDHILDKPLSKIGEKSLFTKELESALEKKEVDFVVHSLKDLPTILPEGMAIGAVCKREDPSDAVVMHRKYKGESLASLPNGSVIGTSSLRRVAQLTRTYPHLTFESVRGNLNTRLKKLDEDDKYASLILASAGVIRMGWSDRITNRLQPEICMYAVGQGALAIEIREDDKATLELISPLNHRETLLCCVAERAFLKTLEGGCSVPVAVHSLYQDSRVKLTGGVFSIDGSEELLGDFCHQIDISNCVETQPPQKKQRCTGPRLYCGILCEDISTSEMKQAESTGIHLAKELLNKGANAILTKARAQNGS